MFNLMVAHKMEELIKVRFFLTLCAQLDEMISMCHGLDVWLLIL